MMNAFIEYFRGRLLALGIVLLGLGGFAAFDQYNKRTNYTPVQARLSKVEELCYMEKRERRTTSTSDVIACDLAQYAVANHPKWQGFTIKSQIRLEYAYVSPVDGRTHSGKRTIDYWPGGKKLSRGDLFPIRASKTDPDKTREA
ncbi:hypothetical protein [Methylocystis echinoides]|uniref:Uncharacterized protein n=1 Tax=Methylocystis echinoides TaxID=29468 RepID=A0A9W6GUJ0_9HYPH|nr:hypothetical protein [Methylocystis echinoides]GLI93120.1 hypothetical protein LMG27198_21120 [Methylocystis echinoides]